MNNEFGTADEFEKIIDDISEYRLVREKRIGNAVNFDGAFIDFAFGIDILVITVIGEVAVDQLHTADFDNAMTLSRFEAGGFCIKNDLAHTLQGKDTRGKIQAPLSFSCH